MNLLPAHIINYIFSTNDPEDQDAYEQYMDGVNKTMIELVTIYMPHTQLTDHELDEVITNDQQEAQSDIIKKILEALPKERQEEFTKKLDALVENYNNKILERAFDQMPIEKLEKLYTLMEQEKLQIKNIRTVQLPVQSEQPATPQPPTPAAESRPAPTISLAPKD